MALNAFSAFFPVTPCNLASRSSFLTDLTPCVTFRVRLILVLVLPVSSSESAYSSSYSFSFCARCLAANARRPFLEDGRRDGFVSSLSSSLSLFFRFFLFFSLSFFPPPNLEGISPNSKSSSSKSMPCFPIAFAAAFLFAILSLSLSNHVFFGLDLISFACSNMFSAFVASISAFCMCFSARSSSSISSICAA